MSPASMSSRPPFFASQPLRFASPASLPFRVGLVLAFVSAVGAKASDDDTAREPGQTPAPADSASISSMERDGACTRASYVVDIDGVTHEPCEGLFGTLEERALFRDWREAYLHVIDNSGPAFDIVHGVASLDPPRVASPTGMTLQEVRFAQVVERACNSEGAQASDAGPADSATVEPAGEWVAAFALDEPLAGLCESATAFVRIDDALGEEGRVLFIGPRGVLGMLGEHLVFLSAPGSSPPAFRMTWRSGFRMVTSTGKSGGPTSVGKKSSPRAPNKRAARAATKRRR